MRKLKILSYADINGALRNKISQIENGNNTNNPDVNYPVMLDCAPHSKQNLNLYGGLLKWHVGKETSMFKVPRGVLLHLF